MFHWDAVDTNANLGGRNVVKTVEMAIWHDTRTTRTESERVFCRWIYLCIYLFYFLRSKIFFWPSYGGDCGSANGFSGNGQLTMA